MPYPQPIVGLSKQSVLTLGQAEFGEAEPGCIIIQAHAAAALRVGDAVYWDANGEVAKSATAADYAAFAGIVVGGRQTDMKVMLGDASGNDYLLDTAANADETVLIAISGIVWGTAAAAVTRGARVGVATTAGEVDDSVTTYTIGVALSTAANAHDPIKLHLNGVCIEL